MVMAPRVVCKTTLSGFSTAPAGAGAGVAEAPPLLLPLPLLPNMLLSLSIMSDFGGWSVRGVVVMIVVLQCCCTPVQC